MRPLALYAKSRSLHAALAALPVAVFLAWFALRDPWTPLSASLTVLTAVVIMTIGLAGQDPELDASTALPWPAWRFWHLLVATAAAAAVVFAVQRLGETHFELAFVVRDAAGLAGLAGLTATVAGARMAAVAPALWWAVSAIMPPGDSLTWRITTWPMGPATDPATTWTAAALFVAGVGVYTLRGGRR